jgi:hypothetical protein
MSLRSLTEPRHKLATTPLDHEVVRPRRLCTMVP